MIEIISAVWIEVRLENFTLAAKGSTAAGVSVEGHVSVTIQSSQISGFDFGLGAQGPAEVSLKNSEVSGNFVGIWAESSVTVVQSQVSGNQVGGIKALETAVVDVQSSTIADNGTDPHCQGPHPPNPYIGFCAGIEISDKAQLTLSDSVIKNNADWGVNAVLDKCGYGRDNFIGEVIFRGRNLIEGNNRSGSLNGKGNPGNHPFQNLPDGQVCLP